MCGRYVHSYTWLRLYEHLSGFVGALAESLRTMHGPAPSYNAHPTAEVPVLRMGTHGHEGVPMRWWLVLAWAESPDDTTYATFNARSEARICSGRCCDRSFIH